MHDEQDQGFAGAIFKKLSTVMQTFAEDTTNMKRSQSQLSNLEQSIPNQQQSQNHFKSDSKREKDIQFIIRPQSSTCVLDGEGTGNKTFEDYSMDAYPTKQNTDELE